MPEWVHFYWYGHTPNVSPSILPNIISYSTWKRDLNNTKAVCMIFSKWLYMCCAHVCVWRVCVCVCVCVCVQACFTALVYLEGHLWSEDKLVSLEQPSAGVHEDQVSNAVNEVEHSLLHISALFCSVNSILKHHAESLPKQRHFKLKLVCMYRLHHDVEVGMGFTQPRAKGPRIV